MQERSTFLSDDNESKYKEIFKLTILSYLIPLQLFRVTNFYNCQNDG